jgi:hypothetical protein
MGPTEYVRNLNNFSISIGSWSKKRITDRMDVVMERDHRLTGRIRGQSDNPVAPAGFEGMQLAHNLLSPDGLLWRLTHSYSQQQVEG